MFGLGRFYTGPWSLLGLLSDGLIEEDGAEATFPSISFPPSAQGSTAMAAILRYASKCESYSSLGDGAKRFTAVVAAALSHPTNSGPFKDLIQGEQSFSQQMQIAIVSTNDFSISQLLMANTMSIYAFVRLSGPLAFF